MLTVQKVQRVCPIIFNSLPETLIYAMSALLFCVFFLIKPSCRMIVPAFRKQGILACPRRGWLNFSLLQFLTRIQTLKCIYRIDFDIFDFMILLVWTLIHVVHNIQKERRICKKGDLSISLSWKILEYLPKSTHLRWMSFMQSWSSIKVLKKKKR